jgi:hypothetical protein
MVITGLRRSVAIASSSSSMLLVLLLAAAASICHAQVPEGPMNTRGIAYPEKRYRQYKFLYPAEQVLVLALGYDEASWNRPSTANTETISFEGLGNGGATVEKLGISGEQWDCFVNHYSFMEWTELANLGVQDYFVTLGWTTELWVLYRIDSSNVPATYALLWEKLSEEEQNAATEVCYFQQIWDALDLADWTTSAPSAAPVATAPTGDGGTPSSSATVPRSVLATVLLLAQAVAIVM